MRDSQREQWRTIELEQVFFHHAAHQVRYIGRMHTITVASLKTITVEERHKQLEVGFLPVVRSRGHQQEVPGESREQLAEPITLSVFGFAAKHGRRHLVRFVADH